MTADKMNGFSSYMKESPLGKLAGLLAAATTLAGQLGALAALSRAMTMGLGAIGILLLGVYNRWIWRATRPAKVEPYIDLPRFSRRERWNTALFSVCLGILYLGIGACTLSHRCSAYLLFAVNLDKYAAAHLEQHLERWPASSGVYRRLRQHYRESGQDEEYIRTLKRQLDHDAFSERTESEKDKARAWNHIEIALTLMEAVRTGEGAKELGDPLVHAGKAASLDPNCASVYWIRGFITACKATEKDVVGEKVKAEFAEASAILTGAQPHKVHAALLSRHHYWLGRSLYELKKHDEAKVALETCLRSTGSLSWRDSVYFRLGENEYQRTGGKGIDKAEQYWQKMSDPSYLARTRLAWAYHYFSEIARARQNAGQIDQAGLLEMISSELQRARELGLAEEELFYPQGLYHFERQEFEQAAANFENASQVSPSNYLVFYWLARSRFNTKEYDRAMRAMEAARELNDDDTNLHFWRGRILDKKGDTVGAIGAFEVSFQCDKDNVEAYYWYTLGYIKLLQKEGTAKSLDERIRTLKSVLGSTNRGIASAKHQMHPGLSRMLYVRCMLWNSLALAYADSGENFEQALSFISEVLKCKDAGMSSTERARCLDTKAYVYIREAQLSDDLDRDEKLNNLDLAENALDEADEALDEAKVQFPDDSRVLREVNEVRAEVKSRRSLLQTMRKKLQAQKDVYNRLHGRQRMQTVRASYPAILGSQFPWLPLPFSESSCLAISAAAVHA